MADTRFGADERMSSFDLLLLECRLPDGRVADIGCLGGRIAEIGALAGRAGARSPAKGAW